MRSFLIFLASAMLSAGVIANAVLLKKQFYPSVVYISKSNPSMAVIYFQSMILVLMMGKLMRKIFLGTLRAAEFEHLMERFWYALTETCLAFTVFRDDFNPKFIALFTVLLFLKSFHWLAEDRVDYMERSPIIGWIFHVRVASLLSVLGFLDYILIMYAYQSTLAKGATVQLVFGFEYAILITMVANTTIKYVLHASELRSDTPWENKAVFLLYTELVIGLIRVILYIIFVFLMVKIYTLPLFAFRPMYYTIRNFKKALNDVILSRRAINNMNTLYPDATAEELALSDNICIICREDMVNNSKKLPCGHIFHTLCLRSWFQRQQTCPTCRLNILRTTIAPLPPQQPANVNNNQQVRANEPNVVQNQFFNMFNQGGLPPPVAPDSTSSTTSSTTSTIPTLQPTAIPPPFFLPSMPFMTPPAYTIPPPPIPSNLEQLTDEELRAMEGNQRRHIIERLKLLKNVQTMLNASAIMLTQYQSIVANLPPMTEPTPPEPSTSSATTASKVVESQQEKPSTSSEFKLEDIGSEEHVDYPSSSTSNADKLNPTMSFNVSQEETSLSGNETNEPSEANEIRKRRLQKFLNSD